MQTFTGQAHIDELQSAQDYQDMLALRESEIDFDKEFPFSNEVGEVNPTVSVFDEKFVAALAMFDIVNDNGDSIFRKIRTSPEKIKELNEKERQANLARYIEMGENCNCGDSIFEQVEQNREIQITPLMLAILGAAEQDELIDADESI